MRTLIAVIVSLAFMLSAVPSVHPLGENSKTMEVRSPAEQLFFVTVRIESEKLDDAGNRAIEISTGFIVTYSWAPGKRGDFLVTSRHAIKDAISGRFFFTRAVKGQPALGETYNIVVEDFENRWFVSDATDVDMAIMPLAWILREFTKRGWEVYYRSISEDMSVSGRKNEHDLDAIEEVIFMGYPSGIFDAKNFIPVARRGVTATPLNVDYGGQPQFLIDASVFPGSSGSPVFIVDKGSYTDRKGNIKLGSRVVFLGMVSGLMAQREINRLHMDGVTDTLPFISTERVIGIGVVYKARIVFDLVRRLLVSSGEIIE